MGISTTGDNDNRCNVGRVNSDRKMCGRGAVRRW